MRRPLLPLLIVLVLQVLLAVGLYLRHDPLAASRVDTQLLPGTAVHAADSLTIESHVAPGAAAAKVVLQKKDGAWILPENAGAPADSARVNALIDRLAGLKRGLPVATSESALRRFKVTDEDFERRVVLGGAGKALATVYFGSSPGLRKTDARTAQDQAVYAVDMAIYDLPTDVGAWLSADLLRVDTAQLTGLVINEGRDRVELVRQKGADKQPDSWNDPSLKGPERIDSSHVATLLQQLASVRPDGVRGTAPQADWQQDHPALTVTLRSEKAPELQWVLSKPAGGDAYVLKSSAQPWYFGISATSGQALVDAAARSALVVTPGKAPAEPVRNRQGPPGH